MLSHFQQLRGRVGANFSTSARSINRAHLMEPLSRLSVQTALTTVILDRLITVSVVFICS